MSTTDDVMPSKSISKLPALIVISDHNEKVKIGVEKKIPPVVSRGPTSIFPTPSKPPYLGCNFTPELEY
jgi:hypothetical protein